MRRAMTLVLLLMFAMVPAAHGADINPGLWQWSATMEMPGMPMAMPPTQFSECITEADLVPQQQAQGQQQCEVVDQEVSHGQVNWTVKCSGPEGESLSRGEIQYRGDSASGTIVMESMGMQMSTRMEGQRLGPCR